MAMRSVVVTISELAQGGTGIPPHCAYTSISSHHTTMSFTSWSAAPKGSDEAAYFTSEHHAVDVAFDWSIELGGAPIIIYCNDQEWMEVTA